LVNQIIVAKEKVNDDPHVKRGPQRGRGVEVKREKLQVISILHWKIKTMREVGYEKKEGRCGVGGDRGQPLSRVTKNKTL